MNKNLTLAVNHALNDSIARARSGLLNHSMGIDAKRSTAWCEYGFKETLDFFDLYKLYRRNGIANGAVNKLTGNVWKTNPEIIEGEKKNESDAVTAWEQRTKTVFTNRLWRVFSDADLRRLVGRYSAILLHIKDNRGWNTEPTRGRALEKVTSVWAGAIKVKEWDTGINSRTYGQPKMWEYTEQLANGSARRVDVHPGRVFILGDYSDDAIGFLEPAYNAFVSLEKVEGGSGESFLKNASRQMNINFSDGIDFKNIAAMYGVSVSELQEKYNEAAREINQGNDVLLITQGATVTPMVTEVADPSPTYNVNLQTACAAVDIPSRIIIGNQQGERASTEDQKYFNSRSQSYRADLSFEIEDFCNKLVGLGIIDDVQQKTVIWDDLNAQTAAEKLDGAYRMAQINATMLAAGEQPFSSAEIRTAAGYEGEPEPLGEDDEEEAEIASPPG
ncbi:anti-CBASS protein Acb1 family protein [Entomohabitans teleogrylli]|uniref:anti-CBASS protein Acb1 family protein n=1 Tax=Entomohabitans teleogrylli TaxID=1384589 RepID=UPI00073D43DE|nr:anti-CBASS Acb1 family protein [Entomohabitans teleogrylli]